MTCGKVERAIQTYVDGAASRTERALVDEHVAHCGSCRRTLAESRRLAGLLASAPNRAVSESFERNLRLALRDASPVSQSASRWERFRVRFEWRLRFPAMVAAGSLAVGVLAAVVSPVYVERQEREQLRQRLVVSAVERHEQLERSSPNSNWEAVDGSIELTTGSIFTE